jgi:nitrogen fixation/metabolism regulation signal transduction histidine kinase
VAALQVARRAPGQARLVAERIVDGGSVEPVLAVEAAEEVHASFGPRVVVIGGRRLGAAFLSRLHYEARLLGPDGALLVGGAPAAARYPRRLVALPGGSAPVVARVEVAVPDDELARTLAFIGWAAVALVLGGLALALFLGNLVAKRISAPAIELAEAARSVSRGRLDIRVPVRTRDEIGELAGTFNDMTRDLLAARDELVRAERVAAWREIAQRIAHEIKNPLTPIQMAIETLQRAQKKGDPRLFDELFAESSRTILDEVARLKHIVAEFSSFARLPAPRLGPCDVGEVVEATLALYAGETPVERELAPSLPPARADRDQLVQVLLNLVENARDAVGGAAGGRIVVRTRAAGERVEVEVADTGSGLSDEARAKLFTPYFTTKAKGTGLGLAIVHRIVSDHGGEIRVANGSERGAVFTVALPRA